MGNKLLIELQFLPSLEYFVALRKFDKVVFDQHEHFIKQTYRNRCYILGANKVIDLVVPVKGGSQKIPMKDVQIDYFHNWVGPLCRSISSAYGKSPFFEFYSDELFKILKSGEDQLLDMNRRLLSFCLECLQIDIPHSYSTQYHSDEKEQITDLRSHIHPKKSFKQRNLYRPEPYNQIFGSKFVADLSIIDLLFCEGPHSVEILNKSIFAE